MGRLFLHYLESPSNKGVYACKKCALHGETVHLARMDDILSKARVFMGPTSGRGVRAGRGARACMTALSIHSSAYADDVKNLSSSCRSHFILGVDRRTFFTNVSMSQPARQR